MARQGITFEQVSATADALVGEGQQPTIKAVRDRLTTGSPNTIHEHLKRWREARPVAAVAAPELPQALTAAIAAEIERAAAQARGEIEGRLVQAQAETDELTAYGNQLEAERDELAEQVAALTSERDTLAGKAAQQAADLADAQQRIERELKLWRATFVGGAALGVLAASSGSIAGSGDAAKASLVGAGGVATILGGVGYYVRAPKHQACVTFLDAARAGVSSWRDHAIPPGDGTVTPAVWHAWVDRVASIRAAEPCAKSR